MGPRRGEEAAAGAAGRGALDFDGAVFFFSFSFSFLLSEEERGWLRMGEGGGGERGKRGERREANGATATSGDAGDESERSGPVVEILRFVVSFRARAPCSSRAYWPPLFRRCIRKIQSWTPQGQRGEPWGASSRRTRANRSTAAELRGQLRRRPFSPPPCKSNRPPPPGSPQLAATGDEGPQAALTGDADGRPGDGSHR